MLSFTGGLKVYVALESCDMRKGFEVLAAMVETEMKEEVSKSRLGFHRILNWVSKLPM